MGLRRNAVRPLFRFRQQAASAQVSSDIQSSALRRHPVFRTRAQARAYLTHPILGQRLTDCAQAAAAVPERTAMQVFGSPDDLKLHSSATLFASLSPAGSVFQLVLERYFGSQPDLMTLRLLDAMPADE